MSGDIGIVIEKNNKFVNLVEVNLSSGYKNILGRYKTAEDALISLQKKIEKNKKEHFGATYEEILLKGWK